MATTTSPSVPSHSRKRSSAWIEQDESENVSMAYAPVNLVDLPSKRLQNSQGAAIPSKPILRYDAHKLLSNLAFTRFYVTANFGNFSPTTSYIILCMVSEQNALYQALCHILPTLYTTSPALQALAITSGYVRPNAMADQALQRILPLITTACVDAVIVEDFERFRREVGGREGCVAVIAPDGTCVWSSTDSQVDLTAEESVTNMQLQIVDALTADGPRDVEMGDG